MRGIRTALLVWVLIGSPTTPVVAQSIPAIGSASTFDVATWNIEWFGSATLGPSDDVLQLQNVAAIIRDTEIDLWAVQEIDDEDHFWRLVDELGDEWSGDLDTESTNLKLGYVYNTSVVAVRQKRPILTQFSDAFAGRPPMQIEAEVALPQDTVDIVLITLHMKAFGDVQSYERRDEAAVRLKNHIDFFLGGSRVIVLGDFNDELTTSITAGRSSPYVEFIDDADDYAFLTLALDEEEQPTWCNASTCSAGSTIDHILITDELIEAYEEGSTNRLAEVLDHVDRFTSTTSDHLPVYARFRFAESTHVAGVPDVDVRVDAVYPNPARHSATLSYAMAAPGIVSIRMFDVLGREVGTVQDGFIAAGEYTATLPVDDLTPGLYFVRTQAEERTFVMPFVVVR